MDKRRIGVRAIIYKDGKILAVKHRNNEGRTKDFWVIPGGGLDPGESLEDGLRREMHEELGIDAQVGRLLFIQQFNSKRADCDEELEFFFLINNSNEFTGIDFSQTTHGVDELAICEFIDPKIEPILPKFLNEVEIEAFVSVVNPVRIADEFGGSI